MTSRPLAITGAHEFTPTVFPDERGLFLAPFQEPAFTQALGHPLFPVAQSNHSRSKRGVVRGIHYTRTPPGTAKYVYCPIGRAIDIAVDIRVGSPTFGQWDSVLLDQEHYRAVYLPVGVGHAFIALEEDTVMSYLLSDSYIAHNELSLSPLDPELGLPLPQNGEAILSARDQAAPTLAQAHEQGLLPSYTECLRAQETTHH
ncbi:dTDP-4-dehydrorhamnose 3,5-epimerase family protein [Nocardiopsis sp. L17-MgMaSL7]|uniref:dTDP-4-dehydrorhamnose 3,5-epimerase family protein n=1 Tax=Nocardiopsis sp. L17-MgMaSL7 TaxID=1938893 RepID=UPI000D71678C|nr:dTDP-4-dehydrorhamnose 3,5-epimerase [Nocardiopsis sp. L17-MgMaSL7]PWV57380.1 dTDP-4-dehydrorhamnose 3,5-epimerase [Nocardiopsis sp. L17-MgMaSL7]